MYNVSSREIYIMERMEVVVTDIRMPFSSMVALMIKFGIASIPAMIGLILIGLVVATFFRALVSH